jgi:hypothetical protein
MKPAPTSSESPRRSEGSELGCKHATNRGSKNREKKKKKKM